MCFICKTKPGQLHVIALWMLTAISSPPGTSDFAEPVSGMSLPQPALSWVWLVDLERTVALLVGRCLGGMLQGAPTSLEEQDTAYWLKTPLFSNGLEMDIPQLGMDSTDPHRYGCSSCLFLLCLVPAKPCSTSTMSHVASSLCLIVLSCPVVKWLETWVPVSHARLGM